MTPIAPYTRESFEHQRTTAKKIERRKGRLVAFVSIVLGAAQLIFIRWADAHLQRRLAVTIEGAAFLAYIGLVGLLIGRMQYALRSTRPLCPQCRVSLKGLSERVAAATGKCDSCGGQVIA